MKTELKVGVFVLMGLGILGYLSTRVSDGIGKSEDGVIIRARFDSVAGLVTGAEVRAAGVRVGHVKSIALDRGKAMVELQFARGVEKQLPKNSRATISSLGLLGEKYVEILVPDIQEGGTLESSLENSGGGGQGGGNTEVPEIQSLDQGDVILVAPPQGLDQLSGVASEIAEEVKIIAIELRKAVGEGEDNRVKAILISLERFSVSLEQVVAQNRTGIDRIVSNLDKSTETLREVLSKNQQNLDATIQNVRSVSERVDKLLERNQDEVGELVVNMRDLTASLRELVVENRASLDKTVQNVETTTGSLSEQLPQILTKLDNIASRLDGVVAKSGPDLEDSVANIKDASAQLDKTMDSVNSIMAKIDEGEGTIGKLINQDEVHDNLNRTMASLRDTLGGFQKFRTYLRVRAEGGISTSTGKGYIGIDLEPDARKFYRIELLAGEEGVEFRNRAETTVQIGDAPPTTITTSERLFLDQLSISAVFGYRFKDLALYGGMLEYRGGLGAEYRFFNKKGWLNFEAFDFGRPERPHLKLTGNYMLGNHVMLTAGWDDPLDSERSTPIVGFGFRIEDEDIKNLLGLAASAGP